METLINIHNKINELRKNARITEGDEMGKLRVNQLVARKILRNTTIAEELVGELSSEEKMLIENITFNNVASFVNLIRGQANA